MKRKTEKKREGGREPSTASRCGRQVCLERAEQLGEGWSNLYDHTGNIINVEKVRVLWGNLNEISSFFPAFHFLVSFSKYEVLFFLSVPFPLSLLFSQKKEDLLPQEHSDTLDDRIYLR